jgi:hypothetical protein
MTVRATAAAAASLHQHLVTTTKNTATLVTAAVLTAGAADAVSDCLVFAILVLASLVHLHICKVCGKSA